MSQSYDQSLRYAWSEWIQPSWLLHSDTCRSQQYLEVDCKRPFEQSLTKCLTSGATIEPPTAVPQSCQGAPGRVSYTAELC